MEGTLADSVYICCFMTDEDITRDTPLTLSMSYHGGAPALRKLLSNKGVLEAVKRLQAKQLADLVSGAVLP